MTIHDHFTLIKFLILIESLPQITQTGKPLPAWRFAVFFIDRLSWESDLQEKLKGCENHTNSIRDDDRELHCAQPIDHPASATDELSYCPW